MTTHYIHPTRLFALCATMFCLVTPALAVDGTFTVTEDWIATLEYDGFGNGNVTDTRSFNGRQTGTLVINDGRYELINRTGLQLQGASRFTGRSIDSFPGFASISGNYAFGPGFGASSHGILFLGAFIVKVPLVDGEVPAFYNYEYYSASGSSLAQMHGFGEMIGVSLRVTVTSTLSIAPKATPATMPAQIVADPKDTTVDYGRKVVLSVRERGAPPLSFQWWKDGVPIEGGTSPTLILAQATSGDSGNYAVTISNNFGDATSEPATLTIRPPIAPVLKIQPRDRAVKAGRKLKLISRAKGSLPLGYQWFFENNPILSGTNASHTIPAAQAFDAGAYLVVVNNPAGSVTSRVATVSVNVPGH